MSDKKKSVAIWFKTARQVHQYLTCPLGEAYAWGNPKKPETAIKEKGIVYEVSEKTIYNHVDDKQGKEKLRRNRAKAFAKRTVDIYAKTELSKVVANADPAEADEVELSEAQASAARRVEADARVKEIDAQLKGLKLKQELGQTVATAVIERELGARAQAFKLYLTSFIRDFSPELLSFLGGDIQVAREIIDLVGGDEEKAEALSGFIFARRPLLLDAYNRRIKEALNTFANGEWFTDEMQEAWERLTISHREEESGLAASLIELVGGDSSRIAIAVDRFEIRRREIR